MTSLPSTVDQPPPPAPPPAQRGALLCADIGNSRTTLGLVSDGTVTHHWRLMTDERRTSDEWGVLVQQMLRAGGVGAGAGPVPVVEGVAVCSTVPGVLQEWREMLAGYFPDVSNVVVEPGVKTGVPVLTDNPREVGSDRIVNALAAAQHFPGAAIIVDFGTAITFDVVTAKGEYVGGAISPGVEISLEALGTRGAQLRKVELQRPRSVIARNTIEALQSGILYGVASQVDGMVTRMIAAQGLQADEVQVIATGGGAPVVLAECATITAFEPWLTLLGLEIVYRRNL